MDFNIRDIKLELYYDTLYTKLSILYLGEEIGSLFIDYLEGNKIYIHSFEIFFKYHRHLGVGRKALEFVKEEFKDRILTLGVEKKNEIAFNFYKSAGFEITKDCGYYYEMVFSQKR